MRVLLATLFCALGLAAAHAQTIDHISIVAAGVMTVGSTTDIADKSLSTGQRTEATTAKVIRSTTTIPAKLNTVFGATVRLSGTPKGGVVKPRIQWRYPAPGLRNPDTGVVKMTDEYIDTPRKLGDEVNYYWSLADDWTLVPGEWILELWDGKRLLGGQSFTLTK